MTHIVFLLYIITIFLGAYLVIYLFSRRRFASEDKKTIINSLIYYLIASVVIVVYYFYTYYVEIVVETQAANLFMRVVDAIIFYVIVFTWLRVMAKVFGSETPRMKGYMKCMNIVFPILMAISVVDYAVLVDEYYMAGSPRSTALSIWGEVLIGVTALAGTILIYVEGRKSQSSKNQKNYIILNSIIVNALNIWNNVIFLAVLLGIMNFDMHSNYLYGFTSVFMLVSYGLTLDFLYKGKILSVETGSDKVDSDEIGLVESREPSNPGSGPEDKASSDDVKLEAFGKSYGLTNREIMVTKLVYCGKSNQAIAEELSISQNTVKRHMHNIFEKTEVSSRMELAHKINGMVL